MLAVIKSRWRKISTVVVTGLGLGIVDIFIGRHFGWLTALGFFLGAAGCFTAFGLYNRSKAAYSNAIITRDQALADAETRLLELEQRLSKDQRRMEILIRLNHSLAQTGSTADDQLPDEQTYMNVALSAITELVGALGCSFVPLDDWQQPLPAFTHGRLPRSILQAWTSYIADGTLRESCRSCQKYESAPGRCPLHPESMGGALAISCVPLYSGMRSKTPGENRVLGTLHLYMLAGKTIDQDTRVFLDVLLREIAIGYESARLRAQEQFTLRQIRLLNAPENDLIVSLGILLDGLRQALDASYIQLKLRPSADARLSNLLVERGRLRLETRFPVGLFERVLDGETGSSEAGQIPVWQAFPMTLSEGRVSGMLLVAVDHPAEFHARQKTILQAVAAQAALLVENDRLMRSLEYKIVIQERTHLAREIHDGLAQTLAYLKLQTAQMQNYLAQGDLTRLSSLLKDNYKALIDAYQDARVAIDNLRLSPQDGLAGWLERLTQEFRAATGLVVDLNIQTDADRRSFAIPLEIQAQLIRMVQETFSNIRKHAQAQRISVFLREWRGDLVLEISDDGTGFESEDVPELSRHGLRGMRERAELIGAEFQIISQRGKGTTVRLTLPVGIEEERPL